MYKTERRIDMDKKNKGDFYFKRSNGELVLLVENVSEKEAMVKMKEFIDDHNFKSYYTRVLPRDGEVWYDVGSHSEFFCLKLKGEDGDKECDMN